MVKQKNKTNRFIELDFLRGFAIIHMILLHFLWDLDYYNIFPINKLVQNTNIIVQVTFFTLVGICLAITFNKNTKNSKKLYKNLIKRGLWIFSLGMIITVVTMIFMPERPIIFGVLHCIGLCIIISVPFLKLKQWNQPIALLMILSGIIIGSFNIQNPSILHVIIGFHPENFWTYTIDYFPIFPWLGVCLLGVSIGNILYKDNKRHFYMPNISKYLPVKIVSWLGKNSLKIYLFHQPAIAGAILLYTII
jgi:uncharacterized membrane protein